MSVHPTAIIDPRAKVPASCKVGPYCVIGADVELGEDCRLVSHVAIEGPTKIGADNPSSLSAPSAWRRRMFLTRASPPAWRSATTTRFASASPSIAAPSKAAASPASAVIFCIMAYAHIGHDSVIGDHCMLVNGATLGGHVTVEEWAVVGRACARCISSCASERTPISAAAPPSRRMFCRFP